MLPYRCDDAIDRTIVPQRIVMRECEPLHTRVSAQIYSVLDRTVTPTDLLRIFFSGVLRVMNEKVGALDKFGVASILLRELPLAECHSA